MSPRRYRVEQFAYACILSVAGLVCGVRLLYRVIDDMTTLPAKSPVPDYVPEYLTSDR